MSNIQIIKNESGKYSPEWFYNEAQKPEWIAFARTANTLHENFINHFGIEQLKSLSGKELLTWNIFGQIWGRSANYSNKSTDSETRACLKNAFCKMCVTICGRFRLNEGAVASYVN